MKSYKNWVGKLPLVGDMLFCLLTIQVCLKFIYEDFDADPALLVTGSLTAALLCIGLARVCRAFRLRKNSRADFYRFLIYGAVLLLAALLWALRPATPLTWELAGLSYFSTLMADRVFSILRRRSRRAIALNLIALYFLVRVCIMADQAELVLAAALFAAIHALISILSVVFSSVNLTALKSVIQKTYAPEILLGLLLMILSFSYILQYVEPNISSYEDAMWYCFAIVTTIGFGDVSAVSTEGRVLSVILGIYGILVVALITSIIVNFYGEMKRESRPDGKEKP